MLQCPKCAGKGKVSESLFGDKLPCDWCQGSGEVPEEGEEVIECGPDAISEFEAEVARSEVDEGLAKLAMLDKPFELTPQEFRAELAKARLSGIHQCQSALLALAVDISTERAKKLKADTVVAKKGDVVAKADALWDAPSELRRRAIFLLYDHLREVEGWAWSAETLEAVCRHRKVEEFEGVKACLECGCVLGKQEAEPKLLTASEE